MRTATLAFCFVLVGAVAILECSLFLGVGAGIAAAFIDESRGR